MSYGASTVQDIVVGTCSLAGGSEMEMVPCFREEKGVGVCVGGGESPEASGFNAGGY